MGKWDDKNIADILTRPETGCWREGGIERFRVGRGARLTAGWETHRYDRWGVFLNHFCYSRRIAHRVLDIDVSTDRSMFRVFEIRGLKKLADPKNFPSPERRRLEGPYLPKFRIPFLKNHFKIFPLDREDPHRSSTRKP